VLNDLIDVPYHHLVLSAPWQLRPIMSFNREVCLSILARAGTSCLNQWARDQHGMRMGIVTVIHTFGADIKWHPHPPPARHRGRALAGRRGVDPPLQPRLAHVARRAQDDVEVPRRHRLPGGTQERRAPLPGPLGLPQGSTPPSNGLLKKLARTLPQTHSSTPSTDLAATLRCDPRKSLVYSRLCSFRDVLGRTRAYWRRQTSAFINVNELHFILVSRHPEHPARTGVVDDELTCNLHAAFVAPVAIEDGQRGGLA